MLSNKLGSTAKHFHDLEKKSQRKPTNHHNLVQLLFCVCCVLYSTHMVSIRGVRVEGSELEANDVSKQHQKVVGSACIKLLEI